jgi:hypothetical protein
MATDRPSAAASIYPHLPQTKVEPQAHRGPTSDLARAMYPNHGPKPQPPASAPRPRMTREEINRAWADVDPEWARMVGLIKVGRR